MTVQDFGKRTGSVDDEDKTAIHGFLDKLATRQNIDALNTVSTISSADETYIFSVSASKTYKAPVSQIVSAVNLTVITNSLAGDVAINDAGLYFTGPTVSQGTAGTWLVSGQVTCTDTSGAVAIVAKLWDGTTVIASGSSVNAAANNPVVISLSGSLPSPAGNLRISVITSTTTGKILFNQTGNSKDSTITAVRIG